MKPKKYFLTTLPVLLLMIFTQGASAHMLFTYESSEMSFRNEEVYSQDGTPLVLDLFWDYTLQFDVTFITPDFDFDLEEWETVTMQFDNPIVSVTASNLFPSISVERSSFTIEALNYEGFIVKHWELMFDIVDNSLPNNAVLSASIRSQGNWDYMTLNLDNFIYTRRDYVEVIDVDAVFEGEYTGEYLEEYPGGLYRLFGKHVSVPEPLAPALLLTGLIGIFAARKIKPTTPPRK